MNGYCCAPVSNPRSPEQLNLQSIGVVRSPHEQRSDAPWQPRAAQGIEGTIELFEGQNFDDALSDIEGWSHIWVLFWFHLNEGWRPKVTPPRSDRKRGVFATRAPYRPNPLGLSALRLLGREGRVLRVADVDLLDGTPVLDIKPYVPWTDAIGEAQTGWLPDAAPGSAAAPPRDAGPRYEVAFDERAQAQLSFLQSHGLGELQQRIVGTLRAGPEPHAYRRIKRDGDRGTLAVKEWRARFVVQGAQVLVIAIFSGFRRRELERREELVVHRAFEERFGR